MRIPPTVVDLAARAATAASALDVTGNALISVPSEVPPFAKLMDPAFASFSLEFQYWPVYAGNATGSPNQYMNQLLRNLEVRTGQTPAIRVGGTSENHAQVDSSFQLWNSSQIDEVYGPFLSRSNTTIGRDWYVVAGNMPEGTEFTFGINMYDEDQVTLQGEMLADAFQGERKHLTKDVRLKYVQVGNEPNFYFPTARDYVRQWKPLVKRLLKTLKMGGRGNPTLWIGSEVIYEGLSPFELTGALEAGILDDKEIAKVVDVFEEHHYSGAGAVGAVPGSSPPAGTLMNKGTIRTNLSMIYRDVDTTRAYNKINFLGEANSYAGEALYGLSNTGESAIWAVDYLLGLGTIGARRSYFHSTPNRLFSVFQPGWHFPNGTGIDRPHIMPMYNAYLIVDEMIGTRGKAKLAELTVSSSQVAAYGVWELGKLRRMAIINSDVAGQNKTMRSAINVTIQGASGYKEANIRRLRMPYTTATEGLTWAGQSFETSSGVPSGQVIEEPFDGTNVTVAASEVVMITFC